MVIHCGPACLLPFPDEGWRRTVSHRLALRVDMGDRLYLVHAGKLWGHGQVCMIRDDGPSRTMLGMGAPRRATLDCRVRPFKGFLYRWWDRVAEIAPPVAYASTEGPPLTGPK